MTTEVRIVAADAIRVTLKPGEMLMVRIRGADDLDEGAWDELSRSVLDQIEAMVGRGRVFVCTDRFEVGIVSGEDLRSRSGSIVASDSTLGRDRAEMLDAQVGGEGAR